MNIFHGARIKLTAWYLVIIMIVSLSFSFFVYRNIIGEVSRSFRIRSLRTSFITNEYLDEDRQLYEDIRNRIITQLAVVNGVIFALSASAGYLLAGKTLHPIEVVMEDQKRFIGDASHELRTPLTSLKTEIEVNLRDKKLTLADAKKLLESNLEEVNKMQALASYLLSLGRYEGGGKKITKDTVQLNKLAKSVIAKHSKEAGAKQISLLLTSKPVKIYASQTGIEELLSIFIDNAIKYSSPKGKVRIKILETKNKVIIVVSDNGVGIKSSDIDYIFNRFYRADTSRTKNKVDGYGLGLAIAKSIVEIHKGKIEVDSKIGKGSTFKVTLPK